MAETVLRSAVDSRGVARLVMNRPELRNAFNEGLIRGLAESIARLSADPAVRAIVITGEGSAFSAGADLEMMRRAGGYTPEENRNDALVLARMLKAIATAPKPVIALVNGPAMGGGVGLVAACDIAIAAEESFFALSEVRLGLIPAVISPFVVAAIGARQARRYFLTGERFDAETAKRLGLVHMVAMKAQLEATLDGVLAELLQCGPVAQGEAKKLITDVAGRPLTEELMADTAGRIARLRASPEGKEGIAAFLEKRKAKWTV
jgi:methylglutaconyl-CoA hydratase